jgi:hypothetical protein
VPFPNPATEFKPGQSGNPEGYSRKRRAVDHLLELIAEKSADKAIAQRWLQAILEGDFRYMREYLDRRDGKVAQAISLEGPTAVIDCVAEAEERAKALDGERSQGADDKPPDPELSRP